MLLIVAFSAGLAVTLTVLGLAVVLASRALARVRVSGPLVAALPAASALLIVGRRLRADRQGDPAGRLMPTSHAIRAATIASRVPSNQELR